MLTVSYSYAGQTFALTVADTATAAAQTAAIQTALDAVASIGGGDVALSAGTWTLTGTGKASDGCLKIGSNTTLSGAGQGETVLKLAAGTGDVTGMIRTASGKANADGSYSSVANVTIKDLSIDGNKAGHVGAVDGVYTGPKPGSSSADTNITLDGVEIANCSRYGFDPHEQTIGLTIRNSSAHHNGIDGFAIDFCSNVLLENNVAYANGRHGFNIVTGSHDVVMTGNDAYGNAGSGIAIQTGDNEIRAWTDTIAITGGHLADNGRAGIEARQAGNVDIAGVLITGNDMDGIMLSGVHGVTITANVYAGNGGTGQVRSQGFLQTFGDTTTANDRFIATQDVIINGIAQADTVVPNGVTLWDYTVTSGNDLITASSGRDVVAAGAGDDTVAGNSGADVLYGNDGADRLDGGGEADVLEGGSGVDWLFGGTGNDTILGGHGSDELIGGSGSDRFQFSANWGHDIVLDFTRKQDKLVFAGVSGVDGIEDFAIQQVGSATIVTLGASSVTLSNVTAATLTASDFVFV